MEILVVLVIIGLGYLAYTTFKRKSEKIMDTDSYTTAPYKIEAAPVETVEQPKVEAAPVETVEEVAKPKKKAARKAKTAVKKEPSLKRSK